MMRALSLFNQKIKLKDISDYLEKKLRTRNFQITDIKKCTQKKISIVVLIASTKYYLTIHKNNFLYNPQYIIKQLGIFGPKIIFCDMSKKHLPYNVILTEDAGEPLDKRLLNNEKIDFFLIGKALRTLHETKLVRENLPTVKPIKELYQKDLKKIALLQNRFPHIHSDLLKILKLPSLLNSSIVISHNDAELQNITWKNGRPIIIDFDNMAYNISESDLGILLGDLSIHPFLVCSKKPYFPIVDHKISTHDKNIKKRHNNMLKKILINCFEKKNFDFYSLLDITLKNEISSQILKGYGHPVSQELLSYYERRNNISWVFELCCVNKKFNDHEIYKIFKNIIALGSISLSDESTNEIIKHIKTITAI